MSVFSERLTNARELKHWTRKRAVAEFGIPYQTYSNYENGKREPDVDTIAKMAKRLDTTIDYLLGNTDNPNPIDRQGNTALTWEDLKTPMPYNGKMPEELKDTYANIAQSFFKYHPEYLNKNREHHED